MIREGQVLLGGPGAAGALAEQARVFASLVDRFGPARVASDRAVFPALVEAICNQQLSVKAGASVYANLETLCEGRVRPGAILDASEDELRACGLSRPKVGYVRDLATKTFEGQLPTDALNGMDDEAIIDALTQVRGIGVWTAQIVLIFTLARQDVLPTGDLGVRDGARIVLGLDERPDEDELTAIGEAWRPYRSLASWYLWKERDRQLRAAGKR